MKARFLFETDLAASVQSNCQFIDKCIKQLQDKKKNLKSMERKEKKKSKNKQLDLVEEIEKNESL